MKGTFHAASRRQRSKSSPIVIGVTVRKRNLKIDGSHPEPVNDKKDEKNRMPGNSTYQPTNPRDPSNLRVQKPMGLTPGIQGLDPRCTETGPPRDKATGPDIPDKDKAFARPRTSRNPGLRGTRDFMGFKSSQDQGLRGIQDFAGPRTSWDSRLRGTRDFVGSRTLQETGTLHTLDQDLFCGVL